MDREEIMQVRKKNQNKTRELEKFYTEGKVEDILANLEKRKKELVEDMIKYAKEHEVPCRWDKDGDAIKWKVDYNPFVVENVFFKVAIALSIRGAFSHLEGILKLFVCLAMGLFVVLCVVIVNHSRYEFMNTRMLCVDESATWVNDIFESYGVNAVLFKLF